MLQSAQNLCSGQFILKVLLLDFETAVHERARKFFNGIQIECFRFHLGQNWFLRIVNPELKNEFRELSL